MHNIILHPYQSKLKQGIYHDWNGGAQNVLAVLPTGGGKSVVVSDIVLDGVNLGMTQAIIAHRNELVSQMSVHIANRGIPHRIVGPNQIITQITKLHRKKFNGRSFINPSARTSVVGVDTMIARSDDLKSWAAQHDRWITDEAHHTTRINKWGKAVNMFHRAQGLGVTATPSRADGLGLGRDYDGVFDTMVLGPTMREIIALGNLSDYEIVCPESDIDLSDEDIGDSGDYSKQKLKSAAEKSRIVGDVVKAYCMYSYGRKAICFATDVKTASKISDNFNNAGIRAASLSAETPLAVREKYLDEFRDGKLWVLINVDLFDEGFDVGDTFSVIMARPTASLGKYLQMVGRALRVAAGKPYALIIDHVSNVKKHGLPDKHRIWTLARRDKRGKSVKDPEDIPLTVCKSCSKPYERFRKSCPYCGFVPIITETQGRKIDIVDGDLILLDRATLEKMRQATMLESPGNLAERVARVAGEFAAKGVVNKHLEKIAAQERLSNAIAQWAGVQRLKGRDDSESYRRFYITTGIDVLSALSADKTRHEYEQMADMVEKWYQG